MKRLSFILATGALGCGFLAGCMVGPNYKRPPAPAPEAYKTQAPWRVAAPKDALPKGAWWEVFNDAELNAYEQQLLAANQSLLAAKDRLDEARSLARVTSAGFFPQANVDPSASRQRYAGDRPEVVTLGRALTQNTYEIPFFVNYEPDLFGKVRRSMQASNANLQGSAADMYNVQLVLTAELAADYFSLRELDAETQVVQESVDIQQKGLQLVESRHSGGVASGLDLAQQQTLLDATVSQLYLVKQQREQYEHAIAVLTGNPAATFTVPVRPLNATPGSGALRSAFRPAGAASGRRHRGTAHGLRECGSGRCQGGVLSAAHSFPAPPDSRARTSPT